MTRILSFLYGVFAYVLGLLSLIYAFGFLINFVVPKSIDSGIAGDFVPSLLINLILLGVFAIQHSVMARPGFKRWWTQFVPEHLERSTYVLLTGLVLILLYWQWRPMTDVIWHVENNMGVIFLYSLFGLGWIILFLSTFMISHTDLFGLRQVYLNLKNKDYSTLDFKIRGLYKFVRHPIMTGIIIAFWATPNMTVGHLLFAAVSTAYILVALQFEEHDLINTFGDVYMNYKRQVSMLIPFKLKKNN